jgi:hypothetical protein
VTEIIDPKNQIAPIPYNKAIRYLSPSARLNDRPKNVSKDPISIVVGPMGKISPIFTVKANIEKKAQDPPAIMAENMRFFRVNNSKKDNISGMKIQICGAFMDLTPHFLFEK